MPYFVAPLLGGGNRLCFAWNRDVIRAQALSFTFTLSLEDGAEDLDGLRLSQFGMHQIVDHVAFFTLRPPRRANYRFIIYARDSDLEVMYWFLSLSSSSSTIDQWRSHVSKIDGVHLSFLSLRNI